MAVLNAVVVPAKALKGGRHKVRISLAHNGETRYIVTNIIIDSLKEFKNGCIVKRQDAAILNTKLRGLIQKYQDAINELDYTDGLSCPELIFQLKNAGNDKRRTFQSVYEEYMENSTAKQSSQTSYSYAWNTIKKSFNEMMLLENLSHRVVLAVDKSLRKQGLKQSSVRNCMAFLRIIVNYAKRCGYVQFRVDPFYGYVFPKLTIRQCWLSVEEIKAIRDLDCAKKNIRKCRDIFMLSYYLGGINFIDLMEIDFNENKDVIKYIRKKTENRQKINEYVEFNIPDEAKCIIEKYKGKDGRISISTYQRKKRCQKYFEYNLKKLAELTGIKKIIYYSARKSFSQHAFNLGVSESVIDYILGHSVDKAGSCLFAYLYVTPEMATNAIRKVLDNLK